MVLAKALAGTLIIGAGLLGVTYYLVQRVESQFPPIGQHREVDGVSLHYIDSGPGDPLPFLFIHGASGNAREMHGALAGPMAGKGRMIFVDRPGAGYSERGAGTADPERQAILIDGLLAELGIEKAIIVGHSYGAAVAVAMAVSRPERVGGLALLAPATHPWPGGAVGLYYRIASLPVIGRLFSELIAVPGGNLIYRWALKGVFAPDPVPKNYADRSGTRLVLRPANFRSNASDVASLHAHVERLAARYKEIAVPTIVITGDQDVVVAPEIHSEALVRDIEGARLVVLPGAGHIPTYSETEAVVRELERLKRRIESEAEVAAIRR